MEKSFGDLNYVINIGGITAVGKVLQADNYDVEYYYYAYCNIRAVQIYF